MRQGPLQPQDQSWKGVAFCCAVGWRTGDEAAAVFVIDQDEAVRDALAVSLRAAGLQALTYPSASHFLAAKPAARPACLLAELDLLDMSATELAERLIDRRLGLPMVIMSARFRNSALKRRLPTGIAGFLEKPFGQDELIGAVRRALGQADRPPIQATKDGG